MSTTEGREAVDFLLNQIDNRFAMMMELLETANLGVSMVHAMQMSSCIFCDDKLAPTFTEMTPEERWLHLRTDTQVVRPKGSIPLVKLPELIRGLGGLVLDRSLGDENDDNMRFLFLDKRERCQHCDIRFDQIMLGAAENMRADGRFIDTEARRAAIRAHRLVCAYVCISERLPLYGNTPGSGTLPATTEELRSDFITRLFANLDDHDVLQDMPEMEEHAKQLAALRNARPAFTQSRVVQFSMLSIAQKQAFLRVLKRVYCPKCCQKIDFKVDNYQKHNKTCNFPPDFTRYITSKVANLLQEYWTAQGAGQKAAITAEIVNADFAKFDNACLELFRSIRMADNGIDTLSDGEWPDESATESSWSTDGSSDDGTDDDDGDDEPPPGGLDSEDGSDGDGKGDGKNDGKGDGKDDGKGDGKDDGKGKGKGKGKDDDKGDGGDGRNKKPDKKPTGTSTPGKKPADKTPKPADTSTPGKTPAETTKATPGKKPADTSTPGKNPADKTPKPADTPTTGKKPAGTATATPGKKPTDTSTPGKKPAGTTTGTPGKKPTDTSTPGKKPAGTTTGTPGKKPTDTSTPGKKPAGTTTATPGKKPTDTSTKPVDKTPKPADKTPKPADKTPKPTDTSTPGKKPAGTATATPGKKPADTSTPGKKPAGKTPKPADTPTTGKKPAGTATATPGKKPTDTSTPGKKPAGTATATPGKKPADTPTAGKKPAGTATATPGKKPTDTSTPGKKPAETATATPGKKPADTPTTVKKPAGKPATDIPPRTDKRPTDRRPTETSLIADPVVRFYSGGADYQGRTLEDLLNMDRQRMDAKDDYIQVLFPVTVASLNNRDAPLITANTIKAFQPATPQNKFLRANLRRACLRMAQYYGFNMKNHRNIIGDTVKEPNAEKKYKWLIEGDRNTWRISRIINSLRLLGMEDEAILFHDGILTCFGERASAAHDLSKKCWFKSLKGPLLEPAPESKDVSVKFYLKGGQKIHTDIFFEHTEKTLLRPSRISIATIEDKDGPIKFQEKSYMIYLQMMNDYGFYLYSNGQQGNARRVFIIPPSKVDQNNFEWTLRDDHWKFLADLVWSLRLLGGGYEKDSIVLYNALIGLIKDLNKFGRIGPSSEALKFLGASGQSTLEVESNKSSLDPFSPSPVPEYKIEEHGEWITASEKMASESSLSNTTHSSPEANLKTSDKETPNRRKRDFKTSYSLKRQKLSPETDNTKSYPESYASLKPELPSWMKWRIPHKHMIEEEGVLTKAAEGVEDEKEEAAQKYNEEEEVIYEEKKGEANMDMDDEETKGAEEDDVIIQTDDNQAKEEDTESEGTDLEDLENMESGVEDIESEEEDTEEEVVEGEVVDEEEIMKEVAEEEIMEEEIMKEVAEEEIVEDVEEVTTEEELKQPSADFLWRRILERSKEINTGTVYIEGPPLSTINPAKNGLNVANPGSVLKQRPRTSLPSILQTPPKTTPSPSRYNFRVGVRSAERRKSYVEIKEVSSSPD